MTADYINPFLVATASVFEQMVGIQVARGTPFLRKAFEPQYEVTGIIGLSGRAAGTVAFSLPRELALTITERLLGARPATIDAQVVDAVGEVTNMIVGAAKAQLAELELSLGLPTVVIGTSTCIVFPSRAVPISIPFTCDQGALVVEVGIVGK
jgi:chemotaxis protein CheX